MLSTACQQYRERLTAHISGLLGSTDPQTRAQELVLALIPPINDDEVSDKSSSRRIELLRHPYQECMLTVRL
jgi:hypothetical protein